MTDTRVITRWTLLHAPKFVQLFDNVSNYPIIFIVKSKSKSKLLYISDYDTHLVVYFLKSKKNITRTDVGMSVMLRYLLIRVRHFTHLHHVS